MKPEIGKSALRPLSTTGALPEEIRASAIQLLDQVRERLALYDSADEAAVVEIVHQTRVDSKRLCALWQLLRPGLKKSDFRTLERLSRGLAKPLGSSRDAQVMQETLAWISRELDAEVYARLQAGLSALLADEAGAHVASLPQVMDSLQRLEKRVQAADLEKLRRRHLRQGLEKACCKGERLGGEALESYAMIPLHGWRKWIKLLLYQSGWLLGDRAPEWVSWLKVLGSDLGRLHDLDVLGYRVEQARDQFWQADMQQLMEVLGQARQKILHETEVKATRLYAKTGRKRARQLYRHWADRQEG